MDDPKINQARKLRNVDKMSYQKIAAVMDVPCSTLYAALNPLAKERNRIRTAEYHRTHKTQEKVYEKQRWQNNRQRERIRFAKWYEKNKARDNANSTAYRKAHMSEDAAHTAARRALVIGAAVGNLVEIAQIYRRAKEASRIRCYLCGEWISFGHRHVDHIVPVSRGGKHRASNLAVACDKCNMSKHDKMPEEVGVLL